MVATTPKIPFMVCYREVIVDLRPTNVTPREALNLGKPSYYSSGSLNLWKTEFPSRQVSFESSLRSLFKSILHPLTEPAFTDSDLNNWTYPNSTDWEPIWENGLGEELCIFDMDNREYNETGQTWDTGPFSWDVVENVASGPFNHYLYGKNLDICKITPNKVLNISSDDSRVSLQLCESRSV
jgi:hypothetical protein